MSKAPRNKRKINWANIEGAQWRKRRLHLEEGEDGMYHCPYKHCDHEGFFSQRGCRKHVRSKHPWFSYFDEKPTVLLKKTQLHQTENQCTNSASRSDNFYKPLHSISPLVAEQFTKWLCGNTGGGKPQKQAQQTANRALRYLKFCCEDDEDELTEETIDFCIGSPVLLCKFVDAMQEELQLGPSAQLGYLSAVSELTDYRKVIGPSANALASFAVTEVYIKRARKTIAKKMKIKWSNDLDIDTLEAKGSWATLEELGRVVPYHLPRFTLVVEKCQNEPSIVSPADLAFATRFVATYLFVNVKGSRPMTYQHLTLEMLDKAKSNGGFVDQKMFKTSQKYAFDSLLLSPTDFGVIEQYRQHVRPLMQPKCDYLLVTRHGTQYGKLCDLMSKQVFEAIGKHIHPTRYRQIVETESVTKLEPKEQQAISEDQKHSSQVAKRHYQKQRSRDVATMAQACMQKLRGERSPDCEEELQKCIAMNCDDVSGKGDNVGCRGDNESHFNIPHVEKFNEMEENTEVEQMEGDDASGKQESTLEETARQQSQTCELKPGKPLELVLRSLGRKRPMRFTGDEDTFLKRGLEKHGFGRWKCILEDPELKFEAGRTAKSLQKRTLDKFSK